MPARSLAALLAVLSTPLAAQNLTQSLELPAHRALMATMEEAALAPFETDGCSGGLSTGWTLVADTFPGFAEAHEQNPPWEACCVTHDRAYHDAGGAETAEDSWAARLTADEALRHCVRSSAENSAERLMEHYDATRDQIAAAYDTIAGAMYLAVRFGGGPCSGLPWRWGYGYPQCAPFGAAEPARD